MELPFSVLCNFPDIEVVTITDQEMMNGTKLVAERMKLVIEYSAGASVAAILFRSNEILQKFGNQFGPKVGVILCGGNI